jgi:hypothetical protein
LSDSSQLIATAHLKTLYIFISILLLIPIIIWPIPTLIFQNPMLNEYILPKWAMSMVILLIAAVVMDGLLASLNDPKKIPRVILWVAIMNLLILQAQNQAWLLAMLFLLHSFRSAYFLFTSQEKKCWWTTLAWLRDIASTMIILVWIGALF